MLKTSKIYPLYQLISITTEDWTLEEFEKLLNELEDIHEGKQSCLCGEPKLPNRDVCRDCL